ncbi:hypothetical protein ScPMuIL_007172 [Solemya velum]
MGIGPIDDDLSRCACIDYSACFNETSIIARTINRQEEPAMTLTEEPSYFPTYDSSLDESLGGCIHKWDINDNALPKVKVCDPFCEWADGNSRYVYTVTSEDARRHISGWAMRNTNNHNAQILKKSCLGVLVCSQDCTTETGNKVHLRPAICDKARRKQIGKTCPTIRCRGRLELMSCHGHCGYPVTHFWRHVNSAIYFQSKGVHDHPRPEMKASAEARRHQKSLRQQHRLMTVSFNFPLLRMSIDIICSCPPFECTCRQNDYMNRSPCSPRRPKSHLTPPYDGQGLSSLRLDIKASPVVRHRSDSHEHTMGIDPFVADDSNFISTFFPPLNKTRHDNIPQISFPGQRYYNDMPRTNNMDYFNQFTQTSARDVGSDFSKIGDYKPFNSISEIKDCALTNPHNEIARIKPEPTADSKFHTPRQTTQKDNFGIPDAIYTSLHDLMGSRPCYDALTSHENEPVDFLSTFIDTNDPSNNNLNTFRPSQDRYLPGNRLPSCQIPSSPSQYAELKPLRRSNDACPHHIYEPYSSYRQPAKQNETTFKPYDMMNTFENGLLSSCSDTLSSSPPEKVPTTRADSQPYTRPCDNNFHKMPCLGDICQYPTTTSCPSVKQQLCNHSINITLTYN